ncbi:MAG TPA: alpha/beta hydrolase [Acidimicrobiales bacterium]|nr:alpha/beta hydrolase [Acidimicrobiales bacterium]
MATNPEPAFRVDSTKGVSVAVHDLGGEGPPLLVAHANGFCGGAYGPLALELASERHVWALDFRGQGQSTPPADLDFDWDGLADDVLAVVAELGGGPIDVIGHSMGGAGLLRAECREPGTIRRAYLYEPIVIPAEVGELSTGGNYMADGARRRREEFDSRAAAVWSYAGRPPLGFLRADALAAYVLHGFEELEDGTARLRCPGEHEARMFEASGTITTADASAVTVPVTVAVGALEEGWGGPARFAPAVADALPNGRLSEHPLLGHFGPLENPPQIADDIRRTLG